MPKLIETSSGRLQGEVFDDRIDAKRIVPYTSPLSRAAVSLYRDVTTGHYSLHPVAIHENDADIYDALTAFIMEGIHVNFDSMHYSSIPVSQTDPQMPKVTLNLRGYGRRTDHCKGP